MPRNTKYQGRFTKQSDGQKTEKRLSLPKGIACKGDTRVLRGGSWNNNNGFRFVF